MKFKCNTKNFSNAIKLVSKTVANKKTTTMLPILEGIKIKTEDNKLIISATNIDIFIEKIIEADVIEQGETVVISKIFDDFLAKISSVASIEVENIDKKLLINYNENQTELMCEDAKAFPTMQQVENGDTFKIYADKLRTVLEKTLFCASQDNSRPILKGALIELNEDKLAVVTLDGHRLAYGETEVLESQGEIKKVIPSKNLAELIKALDNDKQIVTVKIHSNNILFDIGDTKITMIELQGDYVDYKKVLPKVSNTTLIIEKDKLLETLERTNVFAKEHSANYIKIRIEDSDVLITSNSTQGKVKEKIKAQNSGTTNELEVAFNNRYLIEPIKIINTDYVCIKFESESRPVIIKPFKNDQEVEGFTYLVLTIRDRDK